MIIKMIMIIFIFLSSQFCTDSSHCACVKKPGDKLGQPEWCQPERLWKETDQNYG